MSDSSRKIPIHQSINEAAQRRAREAIHQRGKSLPCSVVAVSGAIVTVKFEVSSGFTLPSVTVPVATSQYERVPVQKGDFGYVQAADAYLGGISGLGGGTANLTQRGNLTALVFQPVGNANWPSVDPNLYVLQGPNGVLIQSMDGSTSLTVSKTAGIVGKTTSSLPVNLSGGGCSLVMSGGEVQISGTLVINGQPYLAHTHGNGNNGSPTTGVIA